MNTLLDKEEQKRRAKEKLKKAIAVLALELELYEGRRFSINKGVEEVAKVLKFSSKSRVQSVRDKFAQVTEKLTPVQIQFFQKNGVVFDAASSDAESRLAENTQLTEADYLNQGKKKTVYRGQVTWV